MSECVNFSTIEGKIFDKVTADYDVVTFSSNSGLLYTLEHQQDCCERVYVEDIIGDLSDLEGTPILEAREDSTYSSKDYGSCTWTFYNIRTVKGSVTIRFYGESNGYYSEGVDCVEHKGSM